MPLPNLINVPKDEDSWESWSFANRDIITQIRQAIRIQKNINLTEYQLEPINFGRFKDFLINNAQAHDDFNSTLGLSGSDLTSVDPEDEKQLSVWVYLNWQELVTACDVLGIG